MGTRWFLAAARKAEWAAEIAVFVANCNEISIKCYMWFKNLRVSVS